MSWIAMLAAAALTLTAISAEAGKGKRHPGARVDANTGGGNPDRSPRHRDRCHRPSRTVRVWVPGHYEMRRVERRRPDRYEWRTVTVKRPDRYEWRTDRVWVEGRPTYRQERYLIHQGRWEARVKIDRHPRARMVWIPARYGTRRVRVESPGYWTTRRVRVKVDGGYTTRREQVRIPGEICTVRERVWVPGHYETRRKHRHKPRHTWVQGAVYGALEQIVTGGNHGGFGFSLKLARR